MKNVFSVVAFPSVTCNSIQFNCSIIAYFILVTDMAETQEIPQDEPWLGTVDIILLAALCVGGVYWLFKRNKKEEKPVTRSYAIQ